MHQFAQYLLIGIQLGSIYALIALGYTMVYGVLKLINFAHGDVYMIGAYAGIGSASLIGGRISRIFRHHLIPSPLGALLDMLFAMAACGVLGLVIEQAAYRPLRTRSWVAPSIVLGGSAAYITYQIGYQAGLPQILDFCLGLAVWIAIGVILRTTQIRRSLKIGSRLTALITAIGVSLFIENFGQLILTSTPRPFPLIVDLTHPINVLGVPVESGVWVSFGLSVILMSALTYIVTRTRIGKAIRAVSYDAEVAALMGINIDKIIAITFAIGAALAGAAGVMVNALQQSNVDPYIGISIGLKAFVAAVLGGIGNIPGAMLGGVIMGVVETMVIASGLGTYKDGIAFLLLIVILLVRPAGLLGKAAPEKV